MVKIVVGEEKQLKLAEDRLSQSGLSCEVGLVIGKLSSELDRGFVFDLIQTPRNDAGDPACSLIDTNNQTNKNKKGGSSSKLKQSSDSSPLLSIDADWVSEHARQVSRMLLGGMKVVGIYIWTSESSFKNSTLVLCQTIKGVAEASHLMAADLDENLLIHISYSPRRWTCRNCSVASNITSSSLRPCDFKMGKALASLQTFRCKYTFDMRLPIFHENRSSIKSLAAILRHGIANQVQELKAAKALIDEKLVIDVEQCAPEGLHDVEFLVPFMQNTALEACSQKEVVGVLTFRGSVYSFAYINSKEPVSQVLADIKGDIITSLQSRLDIICDDEDSESDHIAGGGAESRNEISTTKLGPKLDPEFLSQQCSIAFPRRVFVPWLADTYICDYIQPSETLEVLKDHFVELMSREAPTDASKILELETEAPTLVSKSFWDMVISNSSEFKPTLVERDIVNAGTGSIQKSVKTANFNIISAVLTLIVSIFVGLALFFFKGSS
ncbi:Zinc-binding dehydrogenase family oxidoreductase [Heracleum sosnowskyi]|uniref:Zinc-binding dehydrogenase family oxidoreductase n=1 Tax=Heracleum sosnowskyi TaxID=360622 RepID=A0AAD8ILY3_9APIA|nr:Zinc-binding dehydrogenase family oxidoreductase [Heracleum sosnowskyi]